MKKAPRFAVGSFTPRDVEIIVLRTRGMKPAEIGRLFGVTRHAIYQVISRVYALSGTHNAAQLTHLGRGERLGRRIDARAQGRPTQTGTEGSQADQAESHSSVVAGQGQADETPRR